MRWRARGHDVHLIVQARHAAAAARSVRLLRPAADRRLRHRARAGDRTGGRRGASATWRSRSAARSAAGRRRCRVHARSRASRRSCCGSRRAAAAARLRIARLRARRRGGAARRSSRPRRRRRRQAAAARAARSARLARRRRLCHDHARPGRRSGRTASARDRALAVVPDGVRARSRLPVAAPAAAFSMRTARPLVAYAGHLYPWKGVDVLLEALARVPEARRADRRRARRGAGPRARQGAGASRLGRRVTRHVHRAGAAARGARRGCARATCSCCRTRRRRSRARSRRR